MIKSTAFALAASAVLVELGAAQSTLPSLNGLPGTYLPDPSLMVPYPTGEGGDRFTKFIQACRQVLVDHIQTPPYPSTILTRVPPEWTSAPSQTYANAARRYDPIFTTINGTDLISFYTDLCPPIPAPPAQGYSDPSQILPPVLSETPDKFWRFMDVCRQIKAQGFTSPAPPNTIFGRVPLEWMNSANTTISALARKYDPIFTTLSGNDIVSFYNDLCPASSGQVAVQTPAIFPPSTTPLPTPPPGFLPLPISQPRDRMFHFMGNCTMYRLGNLANPPAPNTIFPQVPTEWTSAANTTLSQLAQKYTANYGSLSQSDINNFYNDLCPPLPPSLSDPTVRARVIQVQTTCAQVMNNVLTNLPAPNIVFASSSQGNGQPIPEHMHGAIIATANASGLNFWDQMHARPNPADKLAFKQSLWNRLVAGSWTVDQTTAFWQSLCNRKQAQQMGGAWSPFGSNPFIHPGSDGAWSSTTNGNQTVVTGPLGSIIVSGASYSAPALPALATMIASVFLSIIVL